MGSDRENFEFAIADFRLADTVPHIHCLLPRFELWSKRFRDWTDNRFRIYDFGFRIWRARHLTGPPGQVLWAHGTHDIHEMLKAGLTAAAFLEANGN